MSLNLNTERVILVDENDHPVGEIEKMAAHREGVLHRAFSVFVFNSKGELLLQRRTQHKYHSGGLWTNTCCSHPRPGEELMSAANRRLTEEMGMQCELEHQFSFIYRSRLSDELTEHELDHVFVGQSDVKPEPNGNEVAEWRYASRAVIREELSRDAETFTSWFRICYEQVFQSYRGINGIPSERLI